MQSQNPPAPGAPLAEFALPRFLTVEQLAALVQLNRFTVYHWLKKTPHRLPRPTRALGKVLFIETDVRDWIIGLRREIAADTASAALAVGSIQQPQRRRRGRPTKAEEIAARARRLQDQAAAEAARQEVAA